MPFIHVCLGLGPEDAGGGGDKISAVDVVLYGLNITVPLMTAELLRVSIHIEVTSN